VINQYRRLGIPAEAEIRQLEQKIEVLRAYLQELQRLQEQQSNATPAANRP
jgi:TolA-binding protein